MNLSNAPHDLRQRWEAALLKLAEDLHDEHAFEGVDNGQCDENPMLARKIRVCTWPERQQHAGQQRLMTRTEIASGTGGRLQKAATVLSSDMVHLMMQQLQKSLTRKIDSASLSYVPDQAMAMQISSDPIGSSL